MTGTPKLSVVSPVYQSAENLPALVQRIRDALSPLGISFEVLLIDDGSTDDGWAVIRSLSQSHQEVKGFRLSRNYGQHTAIRAGLEQVVGEMVIVMDCDLQDPPESIPDLVQAFHTDTDAVFARRIKQYDTGIQRFLSSAFYALLQLLSGVTLDGTVANFGLYRQTLIRTMLDNGKGRYFFFPLAVRKFARRCVYVNVPHNKRHAGSSAYSIKRVAILALRVLSSQTILHYFYPSGNMAFQVIERTEDATA